ncbi:unnamed protein product [Rhizophagus irregularis]|nr:unnamed protein product [Rhizophagus irregularis]
MWAPVISILHERNQVGFGMPIVCNNHPDYKNIIVEPDQFEKVSPDGGCNKNYCEFLVGDIILPGCGHELKNTKCWQDRAKDSIKCKTKVPKKLLHCEHYKNIYCSEPVSTNEKCIENAENNWNVVMSA